MSKSYFGTKIVSFVCVILFFMKKFYQILFSFISITIAIPFCSAQGQNSPIEEVEGVKMVRLPMQIQGKDTFYLVTLREVPVYPPLVFKNKKEEKFYWKTVRDVKRALPYAKIVSEEMFATNRHLASLPNDKERKAYMEEFEKQLFKKYEPELKKMTFSQGKMLIKLIDRETERTSFDLIRIYRGGFSAFFWQGFAKIFGADLKVKYDTTRDEDRIIERVITLVEAGML